MTSNTSQEIMAERITAACIDALQRYPDMDPASREYIGEYLLCGMAGILPNFDGGKPYRWLFPLHPIIDRPSHPLDIIAWNNYLKHYCRLSGYKETQNNED